MSGRFYIVNAKTLFIEDFNYDGGGPGMLHVYTFVTLDAKIPLMLIKMSGYNYGYID